MGLKKSYRDGLSYGGGRRYGFIRVKDRKSEKRIVVNEEQKEIIVYLHKILNGKGLFLHAASLEFIHPLTKAIISKSKELPKKFTKIFSEF